MSRQLKQITIKFDPKDISAVENGLHQLHVDGLLSHIDYDERPGQRKIFVYIGCTDRQIADALDCDFSSS